MAYLLASLAAAGAVCLTVQPGREMTVRYARFSATVFALAPFVTWVIAAAFVCTVAVGVIPLAAVSSALALSYRWTLRPVAVNARREARTARARRRVRRAARKNPTAGTVLAAGAHAGHLTGRPIPGQALDLPASDTGTYMLVSNHGVTELQPVNVR